MPAMLDRRAFLGALGLLAVRVAAAAQQARRGRRVRRARPSGALTSPSRHHRPVY